MPIPSAFCTFKPDVNPWPSLISISDENSAPNQDDHHNVPKPGVYRNGRCRRPPFRSDTDNAQYPDGRSDPPSRPAQIASPPGITRFGRNVHAFARAMRRFAVQLSLVVNKKGGFDCPSCAGPIRTASAARPSSARTARRPSRGKRPASKSSRNSSRNIPSPNLAKQTEHWLGDAGRITHPMVLRRGSQHYEPISWADAFDMIADELNALASPDEASSTPPAARATRRRSVYGLFARQFGTNNLPDCSNMCHESSGHGLTRLDRHRQRHGQARRLRSRRRIFIIGQNPGTCHPRMLTELEKAAKNGCKIVSVNPLPETGMIRFKHPQSPVDLLGKGTPIACLYLPVRINGDVALLKGIMKEMLEMDRAIGGKVLDHEFIAEKTARLRRIRRRSSTPQAGTTSNATRRLARSDPPGGGDRREERADDLPAGRWASRSINNGVANVQTIVNFNLLRGQIGRQGAGVCPVRGHSNVQGDRTVGIWEKMSDKFMHALGKEFDFTPPPKHGLRRRRRHSGDARGQGESLHRPGRQLAQRRPGHRIRRRRVPPLAAQRLRQHQAQPQPPHHRRAGADPPVPRPHRERRASLRRAIRQLRKLDGRRPGIARRARAGQPDIS